MIQVENDTYHEVYRINTIQQTYHKICDRPLQVYTRRQKKKSEGATKSAVSQPKQDKSAEYTIVQKEVSELAGELVGQLEQLELVIL